MITHFDSIPWTVPGIHPHTFGAKLILPRLRGHHNIALVPHYASEIASMHSESGTGKVETIGDYVGFSRGQGRVTRRCKYLVS